MTSANLQQWIQHPETLNKDTLYELRTLVARYPFFQSGRLLYLKNLFLLHDITFGAELRKATLYVADRRALFYLIEGDKYALHPSREALSALNEQRDEEPTLDRTLSLIDAFLSTVPEEHSQQTNLDYTTYLLQADALDSLDDESECPQFRGQALIDGFIEKSESDTETLRLKPNNPSLSLSEATIEAEEISSIEVIAENNTVDERSLEEEKEGEEDEDDSCFTETLAKIYVKQQRYSKALEIIKKLSLKYPKKNGYFADQIRFLEKLIINAKTK